MAPHRRRTAMTVVGALLLSSQVLISPCHAHGTGHRSGHGLIGFGIRMYEPYCAFACRDVFAECRLNCSTTTEHHSRRHPGHVARFETSPECLASGDAFLESLAWCLDTHCQHEDPLSLDRFWHSDAVGSGAHQPAPKYGYQESLSRVKKPPTKVALHEEVLDAVRLVPEDDWQMHYGKSRAAGQNELQHTRHGLAIIATMLLLPIFAAFVAFILRSTAIEATILTRFVYPALMGKRHLVPLPFDIGLLPNRGQSAFISVIILLNLLLSTTGYTFSVPGSSYTLTLDRKVELVANRLAILALANLFIIVLYSSRNNPLTRLTRWPHGSFLLYHRWVAYIAVLQVATHGTIYLILHIGVLHKKFFQGYWNAGALAAFLFLSMIPTSILSVRRRFYEVFLNTHIVLAVVALVGIYFHIDWHFGHTWGYENWVYFAAAVWAVERTVRLIKVAKNGLRTASVSVVDEEYLMVTIPNVQATGYAFLYFPTLSWRVWENHPFSISSSIQETSDLDFEPDLAADASKFELVGSDSDSEASDNEDEKQASDGDRMLEVRGRAPAPESLPLTPMTPHSGVALLADTERDGYDDSENAANAKLGPLIPGLTFLIRRGKGMTARLGTAGLRTLPVLVETSYKSPALERLTASPHLVCIIGGAGITSVLPLLHARSGLSPSRTGVYWGSRSPALVREVGLQDLAGRTMDVQVRVGERWDVREILAQETRHGAQEVVVLVSGPAAMADEVRQAVVDANRTRRRNGEKGMVRLVEECFSW